MKALVVLFATMMAVPAMAAAPCPNTVKVEVIGLKSTAATNAIEVDKLFETGEKQTEKEYIEATLRSANAISDMTDTLRLQPRLSSFGKCVYRGSNSKLTLSPETHSQKASATLRIAYVNYKSTGYGNPTSAKGYQLELLTPLREIDEATITAYKSKKSVLLLEFDIQIPLGDYGTDGFSRIAVVGSAESVVYTVIN